MAWFAKWSLIVVMGIFVTLSAAPRMAAADPAAPRVIKAQTQAISPRPCTCRFDGNDYLFGETVCIRGRQATCSRVLNNTSWQFSERPCLHISLLGSRSPRG